MKQIINYEINKKHINRIDSGVINNMRLHAPLGSPSQSHSLQVTLKKEKKIVKYILFTKQNKIVSTKNNNNISLAKIKQDVLLLLQTFSISLCLP